MRADILREHKVSYANEAGFGYLLGYFLATAAECRPALRIVWDRSEGNVNLCYSCEGHVYSLLTIRVIRANECGNGEKYPVDSAENLLAVGVRVNPDNVLSDFMRRYEDEGFRERVERSIMTNELGRESSGEWMFCGLETEADIKTFFGRL